ncbi:uncharacterized protein LOC8287421 [Ricinus communis]|uniref:uncharacterized protein LOC8287421 n=1 Tax=Ricinus communis TaxID=3988 RepID=UPI000772602F|nr:uncharacterized protein LOC8287421 [Ricinus communis]|eukprot:XP_015571729.1 uncharacterized protein LOC8287421 isoform X1 [Ricinus communis]
MVPMFSGRSWYCQIATLLPAGQIPQRTICFKARSGLMPGSIPFKRSSDLVQKFMKAERWGICFRKQTWNKQFNYQRLNLVMSSAADDGNIPLNHISAASMIKKFYTCINEKRLEEIDKYISDNCCFEDCSFYSPIQGKKEVMHFYQQLTTGMVQNVKFSIEHVCEDDEFTVGVNWHLEWKRTHIPFTRGCSFYECSAEGDRIVIKKVRVVTESPIKPGGLAMILLKNVTAIFDNFPNFAEWFLKSPHLIVQFLMKIYTRLLAPFVNPLMGGYARIWSFTARVFALALSMLLYISKKNSQ